MGIGFGCNFTEEFGELCEALGLSPDRIRDLDVGFRLVDDEVVMLDVQYRQFATEDELQGITRFLKAVKAKGEAEPSNVRFREFL